MSGAVIKSGDTRYPTRGMLGLDLRSVADQAQERLNEAQSRATKIVHDARSTAESQRESVRKAAQQAGYEEGLAKGRSEGRETALAEARSKFDKEQAQLVKALTSMAEEFKAKREALLLAARRDVIVLAIAIASRIFSKLDAMHAHVDAAAEAAGEALAAIGKSTQAIIRVHPDDSAALTQFCDAFASKFGDAAHLQLVEDEQIGRGGVVIQTADSTIDATIATRLARIADELVDNWRGRAAALSIPS